MEVNKKDLGARIKKIRLASGETAEQFGHHFEPEANRSLVSAWENGRYKPSPERLKKIAELGNTTVDKLLHGRPKSKYNVDYLEKAIKDTTVGSFNRTAFNDVVNAINEADFLTFGLTEIIVMYTHNLHDDVPPVTDLKSLLVYLKNGYKNMSGLLEVIPDEKQDMLMDLTLELASLQYQINEIEKHMNK